MTNFKELSAHSEHVSRMYSQYKDCINTWEYFPKELRPYLQEEGYETYYEGDYEALYMTYSLI